MNPMDTESVKRFDEALQGWTDERFVTASQIRVMTMFLLYLVNLADHSGWVYLGHSWKETSYLGCLVVKALVDDVPSVVFTNAKTTVAGMGIFLRKVEHDMLEWVPDRYG